MDTASDKILSPIDLLIDDDTTQCVSQLLILQPIGKIVIC